MCGCRVCSLSLNYRRILAIMLGRLRMSVHDCTTEYRHLLDALLSHKRIGSTMRVGLVSATKYKEKHLEVAMRDICNRYKNYPGSPSSQPGPLYFPHKSDLCKTYDQVSYNILRFKCFLERLKVIDRALIIVQICNNLSSRQ